LAVEPLPPAHVPAGGGVVLPPSGGVDVDEQDEPAKHGGQLAEGLPGEPGQHDRDDRLAVLQGQVEFGVVDHSQCSADVALRELVRLDGVDEPGEFAGREGQVQQGVTGRCAGADGEGYLVGDPGALLCVGAVASGDQGAQHQGERLVLQMLARGDGVEVLRGGRGEEHPVPAVLSLPDQARDPDACHVLVSSTMGVLRCAGMPSPAPPAASLRICVDPTGGHRQN